MIKNGIGGKNTNSNGLVFEKETSLVESFRSIDSLVIIEDEFGTNVKYNDFLLGYVGEQNEIYNFLDNYFEKDKADVLNSLNINKSIKPDNFYINLSSNTLYIIEKKFQETAGSVDEKLQTADFKRNYYLNILNEYKKDTNHDNEAKIISFKKELIEIWDNNKLGKFELKTLKEQNNEEIKSMITNSENNYNKYKNRLSWDVKIIYVLNSHWLLFGNKNSSITYREHFSYLTRQGTKYYFDEIPLEALNLEWINH